MIVTALVILAVGAGCLAVLAAIALVGAQDSLTT
jgi:hypothetical protein